MSAPDSPKVIQFYDKSPEQLRGSVETHDYQCPCDMCEPEAHSVAAYPLGAYTEIAQPRKRSAPTLAPGPADVEVAAFESLVKQVGEGKARWSKLLELLEENAK